MSDDLDPRAAIELLGLQPHPEGGWFAETWRDPAPDGAPTGSTAIYFLLEADQRSHWHRVTSAEVWHHYAGAPLELAVAPTDAGPTSTTVLGPDLAAGQRPQAVVAAGAWQAARPLGGPVLVGCTVSPPFRFEDFELAPPGWTPAS